MGSAYDTHMEMNQADDISGPLSSWRAPPARLDLGTHEAHVWRAALDAPPWYVGELESILAMDERIRAAKFVIRGDRERYIVGRGQLRILLGHYLGKPPHALRFSYNLYGKPYLDDSGTSGLSFNVAHARGLVLYAMTRRHVGVDVEYVSADVACAEIARRFFSPGEYHALQNLPVTMRRQAFFLCWSRKEAYVKAVGKGLSLAPHTFDVSVDPRLPPALLSAGETVEQTDRWSLYDLAPGPGYVAALAVQGQPVAVTLWDWPNVWP